MADKDLTGADLSALQQPAKWETDGHGIRGPQPERVPPPQPNWMVPVRDEIPQQDAPVPLDSQLGTGTSGGTGDSTGNEYAFKMVRDGTSTTSVVLLYGEINDTPPTEMTGGSNATLTGLSNGDEVWAVITYDTTTLDITGRSLGHGPSVPTSVLGTLYVGIGSFNIVAGQVLPHNRHCGDINIGLLFGAQNGQAALLAFIQLDDPIAI